MTEKRMLIVPVELVERINGNRGDLSQADFINFLISETLKADGVKSQQPSGEELAEIKEGLAKVMTKVNEKANKDDLKAFQQDTKKLLKSFVDFFIGYGLELGKKTSDNELDELSKVFSGLEANAGEGNSSEEGGGQEVKIKWK